MRVKSQYVQILFVLVQLCLLLKVKDLHRCVTLSLVSSAFTYLIPADSPIKYFFIFQPRLRLNAILLFSSKIAT